jgi:hypothetical protein
MCVVTQTTNLETFDVSFGTILKVIYQNVTRLGFGTTGSGEGNNNMFSLTQCMSYLSIRLSPHGPPALLRLLGAEKLEATAPPPCRRWDMQL